VRRTIDVFVLPTGGGSHAPAPPIEVEANDIDGLERAARVQLARRYRRVRAVSFTPAGMVAYVEGALR
jgi:hypothetical protein